MNPQSQTTILRKDVILKQVAPPPGATWTIIATFLKF